MYLSVVVVVVTESDAPNTKTLYAANFAGAVLNLQ